MILAFFQEGELSSSFLSINQLIDKHSFLCYKIRRKGRAEAYPASLAAGLVTVALHTTNRRTDLCLPQAGRGRILGLCMVRRIVAFEYLASGGGIYESRSRTVDQI